MATVHPSFAAVLAEAGGAGAPASATAGLRHALRAALAHGREELARPRSGYGEPVAVAFASHPGGALLAALPVDAGFAADPAASPPRAALLAAAVLAALHDLAGDAALERTAPAAADHDDFLLLSRPAPALSAADLDELAPLALEERLTRVNKLRAVGLAVPAAVLEDAALHGREPIGADHPLRLAARLLERGQDPADPAALAGAAAATQAGAAAAVRPHDDPDPARRIARRMLQRLDGFGKWGGYHTEFAHLTRGFRDSEKAFATQVAEALVGEGLLLEKPSVGQRHVFLNPRRVADIRALIETGELPPRLVLPPPRRAT